MPMSLAFVSTLAARPLRAGRTAHAITPLTASTFTGAARPRYVARRAPPRRVSAAGQARMSATEPPKKQTSKELAQLYGGSYLGTSIGMSIVSFAVLYALVYIGVDVRGLTNAFGDWLGTTPLGRPAALDNVSDAASAAAIAYVAHKVMSPLRFPLTIAATPIVARLVSGKGADIDGPES